MIRFTNHILLSVQLNSQSQLKIDSENCSLRNGYNTTSKYKSQQKSLQFYTSLIYLQSLELFLQIFHKYPRYDMQIKYIKYKTKLLVSHICCFKITKMLFSHKLKLVSLFSRSISKLNEIRYNRHVEKYNLYYLYIYIS